MSGSTWTWPELQDSVRLEQRPRIPVGACVPAVTHCDCATVYSTHMYKRLRTSNFDVQTESVALPELQYQVFQQCTCTMSWMRDELLHKHTQVLSWDSQLSDSSKDSNVDTGAFNCTDSATRSWLFQNLRHGCLVSGIRC